MHLSSCMDWIAGGEWQYGETPSDFVQDLQRTRCSLRAHLTGDPQEPTVLILSADPRTFILGAAAAILESCNLILGSAQWGAETQHQLQALLPDGTIVWKQQWQTLHSTQSISLHKGYASFSPWIAIATGGTSGVLKLAVHNRQTLTTAAQGLHHFMGDSLPLNSIANLPLHHVSGWMPLWRAWCSGGQVATLDTLEKHPLQSPEEWLLSWVPTQLYRELQQPTTKIPYSRLRGILVGGAGLADNLAANARRQQWPLMPSYGMTETAALVAALKPEQFLASIPGYGSALPHARLHISSGQELSIESDSLFLGYLGEPPRQQRFFSPNDLARWSSEESLLILGRSDHLINTGGEKVSPEQIEQTLLQSSLLADAAVTSLPDPEWGERVVALVQWHNTREPQQEALLQYLHERLARWQIPQQLISVPRLPRNEAGKLMRSQLREIARTQ